MPTLEEVFSRLNAKKREKSDLQKAFKDALVHDTRHAKVVEELKRLREEKKSIENQAWAAASADAQKLDLLALDISSDREMLSSMALTMYASGKTVEVVDEYNTRWLPNFSVTFKKDDALKEESAPRGEKEVPVPEPQFAP